MTLDNRGRGCLGEAAKGFQKHDIGERARDCCWRKEGEEGLGRAWRGKRGRREKTEGRGERG